MIFTTSKIELNEMNLKTMDGMYTPLELAVDLRNVLIMKKEPLVANLYVNGKVVETEKLIVKSIESNE